MYLCKLLKIFGLHSLIIRIMLLVMQACHFTVTMGAPFINVSLLRAQGNFSGYHIGRQHTDRIHKN